MLKLLLVEDEPIALEGIQAMLPLQELDLKMTGLCANALEALDSMADDMPDILLTDVKMPFMDGLSLIELALKKNPAMRCIVLSGYDEFAFAKQAIKLGVKEYLLKPCSKEEMKEALQRVCDEIRMERMRDRTELQNRELRIAELVQKLSLLVSSDPGAEVTADQVRALTEALDAEDILREAFTRLITRQELRAERGFVAITQAYEADAGLTQVVANGLNNMELHLNPQSFVKVMRDYIHAHYREPDITVQYLAENVVMLQADYVGREFIRITGQKLSAYLLKVRMEKAKMLIAASNGSMRVYEVAEAVGLGDHPQYFHTLFRKYTGMTPKAYAKACDENTII